MTEYFWWRTADYFSRWLIGDEATRPVAIEEMDREVAATGAKAGSSREPAGEGDDDDEDVDW